MRNQRTLLLLAIALNASLVLPHAALAHNQLDDKTGQDHAYGSFTAPTTGIHGWFWQNKGRKEVMIHLTTSGVYDSAKMFAGTPNGNEMTIQDAK